MPTTSFRSIRPTAAPRCRTASTRPRKLNATRANLVRDGAAVEGAIGGIPFPIPQNGLEVDVEPPPPLPRRDRRAAHHPGGPDARRHLHARRFRRGIPLQLLPRGHDPGEARQHRLLLQAGGEGAAAACRLHPARAGDDRPGEGTAQRLGLQPRPAPRAPRARDRL